MTERFAISNGGFVFDKEFNAFCPSIECVVKLMNKLNDENEQLKQSDTITDLETQIMHLKDENEELKQKNEKLQKEVNWLKLKAHKVI